MLWRRDQVDVICLIANTDNSKFVEFYVDYVKRFGNKQCCIIDLKPVFSTANSKKDR